jgi:DNA polymerase beta
MQQQKDLCQLLHQIEVVHRFRGDEYKAIAYGNAATQCKLGGPIKVGKSIQRVIDEYHRTGTIEEADLYQKDYRTIKELSGIIGVGPKTIARWIKLGVTSLQTLRRKIATREIILTDAQKLGLAWYDDLQLRIPRHIVEHCGMIMEAIIKRLNPNTQFDLVGSYRRGAENSGDIDIITSDHYIMHEFEKKITAEPQYVGTLSIGKTRFTFLWHDGEHVRQIDILRLKPSQYYTGLLYFTGSWEFNAAMRGYAKAKGYTLNQKGLFAGERLVRVKNEADVFAKLGLKYVEPELRLGPDQILPA